MAGLTQAESQGVLGRILGVRGAERWENELIEVMDDLDRAGEVLVGLTQAESMRVKFWSLILRAGGELKHRRKSSGRVVDVGSDEIGEGIGQEAAIILEMGRLGDLNEVGQGLGVTIKVGQGHSGMKSETRTIVGEDLDLIVLDNIFILLPPTFK